MNKDNIILIGMPASGKSTAGVVLAKFLGYDFIGCYDRQSDGGEQYIDISGKVCTELVSDLVLYAPLSRGESYNNKSIYKSQHFLS